jgi:hypothetical protein
MRIYKERHEIIFSFIHKPKGPLPLLSQYKERNRKRITLCVHGFNRVRSQKVIIKMEEEKKCKKFVVRKQKKSISDTRRIESDVFISKRKTTQKNV